MGRDSNFAQQHEITHNEILNGEEPSGWGLYTMLNGRP